MIDVVYKIGNKLKPNEWADYNELRHSIRSVVKNFKNLNKIYIIGYKPDWLINVEHIQVGDPYRVNKDANLINKMILATTDEKLSGMFLNMSDDMFILKPIDADYFAVPVYNNNLLDEKKDPRLFRRWEHRILRTVSILRSASYKSNIYECHVPYLLNKDNYSKVLFNFDYGYENGYCGNTLYYNTLGIEGRELREDELCKIDKTVLTDIQQIQAMTLTQTFLNYTARSINTVLWDYLSTTFNEKTIYEK